MAWKTDNNGEKKPFLYKVGSLDQVVDEKGSMFIKVSKIAWNTDPNDETVDESKFKLDIRKYMTDSDGNTQMNKGVSFLTNEGPTELVHTLLEEGYGNTDKCVKILRDRPDWTDALKAAYGLKVVDGSEEDDETFDLKDLLG